MLLNEPTPHHTRPAAATAAAAQSARELPAVEVDAATAAKLRAASSAEGGDAGSDAIDTVALNVDAVKRAVAQSIADAATVSLDAAAVKKAMAEAPTVGFAAVDAVDAVAGGEAAGDDVDPRAGADADAGSRADIDASADADTRADIDASADADTRPDVDASADADTRPDIDASADADTRPGTDLERADTSEISKAEPTEPEPTDPEPSDAYLAATDLSTSVSTTVAMPETADDVIATIHAAATLVAAADLRARQAAVAKTDPWTGLDLHQPPTPAPVDNVLDLLAPVLERPLLVVEQPGLPQAADVVALHRSELEVDFVEPPVVAAGAEPPIPPRYGPGLSVLPHIEFPV